MMQTSGEEALTVLLVEDNPADAEQIAMRLESGTGFADSTAVHLLHAGSAAAACAKLRNAPVDVVILDLSLPDARSLESLHRVRAAAPAVPIIVLTGTADEALALRTLRAGAQDYVLKPPPDGRTLRRILRYALERQRLLQELDRVRQASDMAARRWRLLAEVGRILSSGPPLGKALEDVTWLVVPQVAAGIVVLLAGDADVPDVAEVVHVDTASADALRQRCRALLNTPNGSARLRAALPAPATVLADGDDSFQPVLALLELTNASAAALRLADRVSGVLVLAGAPGQGGGRGDAEFCRLLADRINLALEPARLMRHTQRAIAARDRAFSIVSHDLRNPLSTIHICATALLDPEPPPLAGIRDVARIIERSAVWMQNIVQDLLDRASLDAGRLAMLREPTPVADVITAAHIMFAPIAEEEGLEFVAEAAADLPYVHADPQRLLQVLSNLLSNAMKFTPAGGRVLLSAQIATGTDVDDREVRVRFTVSDTGPGIPAHDLVHVFDWYWQTRRRHRSGAGLGLAIARGIVEAHGGRLHVDSLPGAGSTFWFTIPAPAALLLQPGRST